jgi:fructooligosaccharide transport system permease protein
MVANSFKTHAQINQTLGSLQTFLPYTLDVTKWFVSYGKLFTTFKEFGQSILNSFIYSFITIAGVLLINSFCGYALAKLKFPGSNFIINFIIIILIVPVETSIVPLYVILKQIGLLNENLRVVGYLLPGLVSPFYIFMFRSYFLGIPKELEEAAIIEGAGRLKVYFKIVVPLSLPVFATVGIFAFMGSWNEYIFAQLMFSKPIQQPLQVYLQLINNFNPKDMSLIMASLTFSTLPIAIVYIFAQKYIVDGVTFTGLK